MSSTRSGSSSAVSLNGVIFQGLQLYVSKSLRIAVQLMLKVESVTTTAPVPIETLFPILANPELTNRENVPHLPFGR